MLKKSAAMLAIASLVLSVSCKENAALKIDENAAKQAEIAHAEAGKMPVIKFETTEHDFGTIKQGDKVEYVYKFTNEGAADLVISQVKPSCGCTAPEWTKTPVAPGASGEIKVVFDSNGKSGKQSKTVNVHSNTESGTDVLKFTAEINAPQGIGAASH
ncbi:DUF1573 domain-containing protein [Flavobacterium beibuense]|uniref:DUF1573 domain containing protein n=1 Tax=Flavobacterium beibuense TaxID=657326 RepID=A0A444WAS1_9FLAO|nr:DUF1573 domain-containing protein [Flavobacterium beibuense]RYJ42903.1 DUF1573 domain containing protein [Flavobacterium beibuense]